MTTIPALNNVTDILDSDLLLVTHSDGSSYKIAGSEINKRNQAVIAPDATPTTLTGAPLKTGNIVRVYWKVDLTAANGSAPLLLSYNGVNYYVKVPKNGTLTSFLPFDLGGGVYKYLQAYTTLDLLYDGTQFVIVENTVVITTNDYTIYANGYIEYHSNVIDSLRPKEIYEEKTTLFNVPIGNIELVMLDWRGYAGYYWLGLIFSFESSVNIMTIATNTSSSPISVSGHDISVSYEGQTPMVTRYKMNTKNFY